jgi:hypothetical protein
MDNRTATIIALWTLIGAIYVLLLTNEKARTLFESSFVELMALLLEALCGLLLIVTSTITVIVIYSYRLPVSLWKVLRGFLRKKKESSGENSSVDP